MSTFIPRPQDINRKWYVLDASGKRWDVGN
jgi:hypothetical protein